MNKREPHIDRFRESRGARPKTDDFGHADHAWTIAPRNSQRNNKLQFASYFLAAVQITSCNMMQSKTPAERLRVARARAGYPNAKAFAERHDIPQPTYAMHEKGDRLLRPHVATRYARLLNVSDAWLLTGHGDGPEAETAVLRGKSSIINEVDIRAEAGAGGFDSGTPESPETIVERWMVPAELLRAHTTAGHAHLRIIRVYGDSMLPVFRPGDRLLVDTSDRLPSPPGVFVLWDGLGIVVKRLEFVPYSDPPTVRLMSSNPSYEAYLRALAEVSINGRVIGRWDWT